MPKWAVFRYALTGEPVSAGRSTDSWRTERARHFRRTRTFAALCAASSGERRSPGDARGEGAAGSLRQSAPCADDREGPPVPRPARAALPREDTAGSNATEERGSTDATRLSSVREIEDFPLAVRTRRVLTTLPDDVRHAARILRILAPSRESFALSNDSESRAARRRRRLEPCERAVRGGFTASNSRRGAPRMAREQTSRAPRAFWIPNPLSEYYPKMTYSSHCQSSPFIAANSRSWRSTPGPPSGVGADIPTSPPSVMATRPPPIRAWPPPLAFAYGSMTASMVLPM